jgi:hypothetical protein
MMMQKRKWYNPPPLPESRGQTDLPAVQEESPANKRIQDFATRANLTGKEGIDRRSSCCSQSVW